MNREIKRELKFRVWNKTKEKSYFDTATMEQQYMDSGYMTYFDILSVNIPEKDYILMQYTGMKDTEGKEIYEGDIVTFEGITLYEVKFIRGGFAVEFKDGHRYLGQFANPEVIGNIYQNPELFNN